MDAKGDKIPGIGALDHYTLAQDHNRFIGDIVIKNEETGETYHGFENHQGRTFLGNGERALVMCWKAKVTTAKMALKALFTRILFVPTFTAQS